MQGGASATGTITGNFAPGSVMSINIIITAYHNGRYRFRVCKMSATGNEFNDLTEACLDQHVLVRYDWGRRAAPTRFRKSSTGDRFGSGEAGQVQKSAATVLLSIAKLLAWFVCAVSRCLRVRGLNNDALHVADRAVVT